MVMFQLLQMRIAGIVTALQQHYDDESTTTTAVRVENNQLP